MNLLQRIKEGANRATEKAQHAVEIGKLNSQISSIQQEMDVHFLRMGQVFYQGYRIHDMTDAEKEMMQLSKECDTLQADIDALRNKIAEMKNERLCECGYVAALDANFCPKCGRKLGGQPAEAPVQEEAQVPASSLEMNRSWEPEFNDSYTDDYTQVYTPEYRDEEREEPQTQQQTSAAYEEDPFREADYADTDFTPEEKAAFDAEWERRRNEELERERERQQELDERIRYWQKNNQEEAAVQPQVPRDTVKCQICSADLPKGSKWCPRCGAEQI
ncbi:zinc ribbon domain-containing protein [Paenibacillus sp. JX-17]|uniref:Zinc ribbon domain-containing protein n=1 Tax=Paenibacillus lacisoli TaxID=3064525 RepID=A0ABT9CBM8_9BACL|nr:zinc ribbon domain-containing protein [Paenibacillus sp. JX-17]MDO7906660.1 zinc ribbon domain-containing protein [Paenibacillus sp. JX-17]